MTRVDPNVVRQRVLERLQWSDAELDESDLPDLLDLAPPRPSLAAHQLPRAHRRPSSRNGGANASGASSSSAGGGRPWGHPSAPPARPSKTSSTSRGASLSLLKREAAARGPGARRAPARDAVARHDESDDRGDDDDVRDVRGDIRESANPRAPRSGRRGERNASVYTRLLRESRRPPRASSTANEISAAPVVPDPPRVSRGDAGGHTTTEDEGGGYWANTEPDDGGTTDARDEPEHDHGEVTSGRAAARRAWIDAGGSPECVPIGAANRTRRERVDESEDPAEDPEEDLEDPEDLEDLSSEDPSSEDPSSEDSTYVPSGADASSEPAEKSESRFETPSDSPSASSVARGDSARNDPDPDDVDVAATLRADNRELRGKLREAASTLSAAAKERVSSEAERARLRRELRDGEANRRRAEEEWSRREAELVGAKTGALRAKATAEARAKSAERRSERGRKHSEEAEARVAAAERRAKDANRRAEDAERRAKDANRRAEDAERRAATVEEDLARARDALALMTETAEEARAEAKAMAVWRIEQKPQETAAPAASTPPPVASTPPPAASTPPPRADDDETSNRERATALAEELASLRAALAGELAAAKRAEQDSERLRARVVEAESDARAAWFALHAERSRPRGTTFPAAPESTPPPGPAAELLALVSPSLLSESDDAVHLAAQVTALDKVVSHLNSRRMKRTSGGGGVGSNSNGVVFQRTSRFPDARAARFFCFKYWQELARTPPSPATPSSTGDAFAFDVARGESSVTSRGMPWSSGRGTSPRGGAPGATS